jgi:phosphate transport system substrate-binding protein
LNIRLKLQVYQGGCALLRKNKSVYLLVAVLLAALLSGCAAKEFNPSHGINIITREDGSGTRTAFVDMFGITQKGTDEDGNATKHDLTTKEAIVAKQTNVLFTNVSSDLYAIGYGSLGALSSDVKTLAIEGVLPSPETVRDGTYPVSRAFFIAIKGDISDMTPLAQDFISYILSEDGQDIAAKNYISIPDTGKFTSAMPGGRLVVAGSSSVTPLMEKLQEAYLAINKNAKIEIQESDSSSGIRAAMDGTCQIGMSSRVLTDDELQSLTPIEIALDGLAILVNPNNPVENMTKAQVRLIFIGETTSWAEVVG